MMRLLTHVSPLDHIPMDTPEEKRQDEDLRDRTNATINKVREKLSRCPNCGWSLDEEIGPQPPNPKGPPQ